MIDSLIVGNGEIGRSLLKVLEQREGALSSRAIDIKDSDFESSLKEGCKTLHICFPYSESFEKNVIEYIKCTNADLTIIHSTVQVGTTSKIAKSVLTSVVHSPVQGQHPDLEKSILHFHKFVGTIDWVDFESTQKELSNVFCIKLQSSETSELGKLLSTSYYGLCIAWHREMKEMCDKMNVNFADAVTRFNKVYNEGYAKLKPNVIRPVLTPPPGSIGGHCVVENARLLEQKVQSEFLKLIW